MNTFFSKESAKFLLFYGILVLLLVPVLGLMIFSNDIFKALYSGRYLSTFYQFPHHSTFTFSPVLDHLTRDSYNWLGNLILITVYQSGGFTGLQIFRGVLVLSTILMIHSLYNWKKNPVFLLLFFFLAMSLSQKFLLRTAIFAVPGLTLVLWSWLRARYNRRYRLFWLIPVALLFWSQLHGSYLIGVGLLILLIAGDLLDRLISSHANMKNWLFRFGGVLLVTLFAVTFVKPFPDYTFLQRAQSIVKRVSPGTSIESDTESRNSIVVRHTIGRPLTLSPIRRAFGISAPSEEQEGEPSTWYHKLRRKLQNTVFKRQAFRSEEFKFPLEQTQFLSVRSGIFLGALILLFFLIPPYRSGLSLWLPLLTFLVLGIGYARTVAYMGLVPVMLFSVQYRQLDSRIFWSPWLIYSSFLAISLLLGNTASLVLNGNLSKLTGNPGHTLGYGQHHRMDPKIPVLVRQEYRSSRFFNSYETGSYLIWKWWPFKKVFVDTKMNAYDPDYQRYLTNTPLPEILRQKNLKYAIFERSHFWHYYFNDQKNWQPLMTDPFFSVYSRRSGTKTE